MGVNKLLGVFCFLIFFGCGKYYQKEYFTKYTEISSNKSSKTKFKTSGVYKTSFVLNNKTYTDYTFYYENNLCTSITLPRSFGDTAWIRNDSDLVRVIRSRKINKILSWNYYEVSENEIVFYYDDTYTEGAEAFPMYIIPIIKNSCRFSNDTIYPYNKSRKIDRIFGIRYSLKRKIVTTTNSPDKFFEFPIKPDSTSSNFIKEYKNYLINGTTRYKPSKE